MLARRRLERVDPKYGVDLEREERAGRLSQHIEGEERQITACKVHCNIYRYND